MSEPELLASDPPDWVSITRSACQRRLEQFSILKMFYFSPDWNHFYCRKLREEYDKLEGALKKLGVDPECVVTEEEDGYNAESDLEEDTEQDCEREVATFVPAVYTVDPGHRRPGPLARVDEVGSVD